MANSSMNAFDAERKREGYFQCERCGAKWPLSHMRTREGKRVCAKRCRPEGKDKQEIAKWQAEYGREWREYTNPLPRPRTDATPGITSSPEFMLLAVGVSDLLELSGVNLASDRIAYSSDESIVFSAPTFTTDGRSASVTVIGSTPGNFPLKINGYVYKQNFFRVRS